MLDVNESTSTPDEADVEAADFDATSKYTVDLEQLSGKCRKGSRRPRAVEISPISELFKADYISPGN